MSSSDSDIADEKEFSSAQSAFSYAGPGEMTPELAAPVPTYGQRPVHEPGPVVPATSIEFPEPEAAIDLLIKQLRKNKTNREFMLQVASSAPLAGEDEED